MMRYPIKLAPDDNDTLLVTSPDFPELATFGADAEDAARHAADALVTVIAARIADRETVPAPSRIFGPAAVLDTSDALKIALYRAMTEDGVGKAELARRLACHLPQIDRLLDLHHASKLEQIEAALHALGREIKVRVAKAAA